MNNVIFRILIIDDMTSIHEDFKKILTYNSNAELDLLDAKIFGEDKAAPLMPQFILNFAAQGAEGVACVAQALAEKKPYALAFVDIRMPPGIDGVETIRQIWQLDNAIQIVICTAYSDYSWEDTINQLGHTDNLLILKKPFDNIEVRQLACALTKKWQLMQDVQFHTLKLEKKVLDRTAALQHSLSLVKATFESSGDGIVLVNSEREIVDYNTRFVEICAIPPKMLTYKHDHKIMHYLANQLEGNATEFLAKIEHLYKERDSMSLDVLKFKNGCIIERYSQPQKIKAETVGRIWSYRDITQRAKLEAELHYQAKHDSLTGLYNRVLLHDSIRDLIHKSTLNNTCFAVLFIDLDRFKSVNDSFSHAVGDELLLAVGNRLKQAMRPHDMLARLGGDEFVMIVPNVSHKNAVTLVDKILTKLIHLFKIANRKITVTACIGISLFPKDGSNVDSLMRNADAAMYCAKEYGFNRFEFYSPKMNKLSLNNLDREFELRQAILNNEFILCYQPQINLITRKMVAVEALLRWQHPTQGLISPIDFIPLAEKSGLIVQIGEWVINTACAQLNAWHNSGLPVLRIAVNVAEQQLKEKGFVKLVKTILQKNKVDAALLELELTENVIISTEEVIMTIKNLKKLGVSITLDDFGTGYASVSYLKKIPLDRIKIDKSFVKNITKNKDDEAIIRAMIAMARSLNLEVIAEGLENTDQLDFLIAEQCDHVQGFYFSKSLSPEQLAGILKNAKK